MMLASPLLPPAPFSPKVSSSPEDPLSFRPARDVEAFNSLLPPPIEFVEGSSSGALAVPEGKYQPINVSPKLSTKDRPDGSSLRPSSSPATPTVPTTAVSASSSTPSGAKNAVAQSTLAVGIDLSWPETCDHASGLYNTGNTCFLNSALQCLLHTPPLLRVVIAHVKDKCRAGDKFCMVCAFRQVTVQAHKSSSPFAPHPVSSRLQTIAKHMRRGRQEDSHEFLRYAIDAMQKACLNGASPKVEAKLAEATWVHKIFGGKLRSRVSCQSCGHNSDTFDRILDLSLDIIKADSLKEALKFFISPDYLKGADKYKCEKCKKHVNAEKRFTIHEAPTVLTVHLKRFSPLGRKIGHHVTYDETLNLQPYMSKDQFGPTYSLYGIICHAGGGPNSGHYYAFVKSRTGRWYEMNDEMVSPISGPPVNKKMAYILFYLRNKGQGLQAALKSGVSGVQREKEREKDGERTGLVAGMKKREREEDGGGDEEDVGEKVNASASSPLRSTGPLLPSPVDRSCGSPTKRVKFDHDVTRRNDPQAEKIKQKILAAKDVKEAKAKKALAVLEGYDSSDSSSSDEHGQEQDKGVDTVKEKEKDLGDRDKGKGKGKGKVVAESDEEGGDDRDGGKPASSPVKRSSPARQSTKHVPSSPISSNNFYGPSSSKNHPNGATLSHSKRPSDDSSDDEPSHVRSPRKHKDHYRHHNKRQRGSEKAKMRMSIESGSRSSGQSKGYVNPFSRIGSENSASSRSGGTSGRMNTYGKRRHWRPRAL